MHIWTLLLASGHGTRITDQNTRKQFLPWKERPLYWHSALALAAVPSMRGIIVTFPEDEYEARGKELADLGQTDGLGLKCLCCSGGSSRQESVAKALHRLPPECTHVLIHDAARPFVRPFLIQNIITSLASGSEAVVPALPVTDTIKEYINNQQVQTLDRSRLFAVQTPQGFPRDVICKAHSQAAEQGWQGTDDASLVEELGFPVHVVSGQEDNVKITTNQDLERLREQPQGTVRICMGWGYDVHRFGPGKAMRLGGVPIANGPEIVAHSDGDVLLHALMDAILGCLGQGDIGEHFPDSDPEYENIQSGVLLAEILELAARHNVHLDHVDLTLIAEIPKITPWKAQIKKNIQSLLGLPPQGVNLKATTEEGLGFTGHKQGIKAVAQVVGHREDENGRGK